MLPAKQPHLLVCISGHGYGHAAQTVPVLNVLSTLLPDIRLTIRSRVPLSYLRERLRVPFSYLHETVDIGLLMASALDVRAADSVAAYKHLHQEWGLQVRQESQRLAELAPDFVLSNVGYLPLAGAYHARIPCAAMSSLNWADIFEHYCGAMSGTHGIIEQMRRSYCHAQAFLRMAPAMPMGDLPNRLDIEPVAHLGNDRREEIRQRTGLAADEKLVLVSLGGIGGKHSIVHWPRLPKVRWMVPENMHGGHPDALVLESLELPFSDVLASSDALVCKPGYGSFVEAAHAGVPLLYAERPDWPETPYLKTWLAAHGRGSEISRSSLVSGDFAAQLQALWQSPCLPRPAPDGAMQAAQWLAQQLDRQP